MGYQVDNAGPDGFPARVVDEAGRVFGAFPSEAEAERVRFLLDSYAGSAPKVRPANRPKPATERGTVSSRGAWGGEDKPRAGVVYNLSGLADPAKRRAEPVSDVRGEVAPKPEPIAATPVGNRYGLAAQRRRGSVDPVDVPPALASWSGREGSTVRNLEGDGFSVSFPRRPSVETRDALKAAGFRWRPAVKAWHGRNLPAGFRP